MEIAYQKATALLPEPWRSAAHALSEKDCAAAEEIRLRVGQAASVLLPRGEVPLSAAGAVTASALRDLLERASGASVHAVSQQLRQGMLAGPGRAGDQIEVRNTVFRQAFCQILFQPVVAQQVFKTHISLLNA